MVGQVVFRCSSVECDGYDVEVDTTRQSPRCGVRGGKITVNSVFDQSVFGVYDDGFGDFHRVVLKYEYFTVER